MVTKKNLSEDDTGAKFITPALYQAGWAEAAIRRQVACTPGSIIFAASLLSTSSLNRFRRQEMK